MQPTTPFNPKDAQWYPSASKSMECCVCTDLALAPFFLCSEQHIGCSGCATKLKSCPMCRAPLQLQKASALERVIAELTLKCIQCAFIGNAAQMEKHWKEECAPCRCECGAELLHISDKHECVTALRDRLRQSESLTRELEASLMKVREELKVVKEELKAVKERHGDGRVAVIDDQATTISMLRSELTASHSALSRVQEELKETKADRGSDRFAPTISERGRIRANGMLLEVSKIKTPSFFHPGYVILADKIVDLVF